MTIYRPSKHSRCCHNFVAADNPAGRNLADNLIDHTDHFVGILNYSHSPFYPATFPRPCFLSPSHPALVEYRPLAAAAVVDHLGTETDVAAHLR